MIAIIAAGPQDCRVDCQSFRFPRSHRLSGRRAFAAAFDTGLRQARGPLVALAIPNALPHSRLGLSVSRKVGNAVKRGAVKRKLREAFRLSQHELPPGYDLVIAVRPHELLPLEDYQSIMKFLATKLDSLWKARKASSAGTPSPDPLG